MRVLVLARDKNHTVIQQRHNLKPIAYLLTISLL